MSYTEACALLLALLEKDLLTEQEKVALRTAISLLEDALLEKDQPTEQEKDALRLAISFLVEIVD